MEEVISIVITGGSGPAPDEEAYSDKIAMDRSSMTYEYTPLMEGEINVSRKWSYQTTSPIFKKMFWEAAAAAVKVLDLEEGAAAAGIGETAFRVTFADGSVIERVFRRPGDDFKACFDNIKKMVPPASTCPRCSSPRTITGTGTAAGTQRRVSPCGETRSQATPGKQKPPRGAAIVKKRRRSNTRISADMITVRCRHYV